jgi:hypothetical protein
MKHDPLTPQEEQDVREFLGIERHYDVLTMRVRHACGLLASLDKERAKVAALEAREKDRDQRDGERAYEDRHDPH